MLENDLHQILAKAVSYCARAEKCSADIRNKLHDWGIVDEAIIRQVIDYLIVNNYIDHSRYAQAFVHDAVHLQKYGKLKIKYLLMQKRIEPDCIESALETIDSATYQNLIRAEIKKRLQKINFDEYSKQKLIRALLAKGFEIELITKLLQEVLKNAD